MRFRLTAELEADAVSAEPFQVKFGDFRVGVSTAEKGEIVEIWADLPIENYDSSLPVINRPLGQPMHLDFREPPHVARLLATLQYLESLGSFWLGINRIQWGRAKHEWIPESPEERSRVSVFAMTWDWEYERRKVAFRPDILRDLLVHQEVKEWLTIPLSFFREGRNEYRGHRYVNAFYNFYFFLEDQFGQGKTQNRQILEAFSASDKLQAAAMKAYQACGAGRKDLRPSLQRLMSVIGGDPSPEGLLKFLVRVRGELHHFSRKSTRPKGHPLNQQEFHPVAFFAMAICLSLLPDVITGRYDLAMPAREPYNER